MLAEGFEHSAGIGLGPWENQNYPDRVSSVLLGAAAARCCSADHAAEWRSPRVNCCSSASPTTPLDISKTPTTGGNCLFPGRRSFTSMSPSRRRHRGSQAGHAPRIPPHRLRVRVDMAENPAPAEVMP